LRAVAALAGCSGGGGPTAPRTIEDGVLYDVAGTLGRAGNGGDEGPAVECYLYWVIDATPLPNGDLLVMDWNNHRIRRITPDGVIHGFIGSGILGDGVSGPGPLINFNHPTEIKVGPDGAYYVAAYHNWKVKRFDPVTLECSIPVGTGRGFGGDGGPAAACQMDLPSSLEFDPAGNMYVADQGNQRIRVVDAETGIVTTFAGGSKGFADGVGEQAMFSWPGGTTTGTGVRGAALGLAPDGEHLYVTDSENHRVRKIHLATRTVTTIAGTGIAGYSGDGGPALSAQFRFPSDLAVAANGDLYIADYRNHAVRKIDAAGTITTVAGTGEPGHSPDGTPAREASLELPQGIAFDDRTHTLYIADTWNHMLKMVRNP
jgi:sugar lactone lactonase YvrE